MSDYSFSKVKVGVIDLKSHNLFSILQAMKNIGYKTTVLNKANQFKDKDIIILPGVGSFKYAMNFLKNSGLSDSIKEHVQKKKTLFGICLGMQLLFSKSEEFGKTNGLNIFKGKVIKFNDKNLKIPHIGWNKIDKKTEFFYPKIYLKISSILPTLLLQPHNDNDIHAITHYGRFKFCSSVVKKNIVGTQFHPEKSGKAGLKILKQLIKI